MTRILCLDDDREIGNLLTLILEKPGYEVLLCAESYEAWALLHSLPVDLFTQDMMRPDIPGEQFCSLFQADPALQDVPIMIVSARHPVPDDLPGLQVDAYVTKPFVPAEFLDTIAAILARRDKPGLTAAEQAWGQAQFNRVRSLLKERKTAAVARSAGRLWAIRGADRFSDVIEVEPLEELLTGPALETRLKAAHDLGLVGDGSAVKPLRRALREDTWPVRWAAAQSLGQLGASEALPELRTAFNDEHPLVRGMAALALGDIGDPQALDPLLSRLAETDGLAYAVTIMALGRLAQPGVISPLLHIAAVTGSPYYWLAWSALYQLTRPIVLRSRKSWPHPDRPTQCPDSEVVHALVKALDDPEPGAVMAALTVLEKYLPQKMRHEDTNQTIDDIVKAARRRLGRTDG